MKYGLYILSTLFIFLIVLGVGINRYRMISLKKAQMSTKIAIEDIIPSTHDCIWTLNDVEAFVQTDTLMPNPLHLVDWEVEMLRKVSVMSQAPFALFEDECWMSACSEDLTARLIMVKVSNPDLLERDRFLKQVFVHEQPIEEQMGSVTIYYLPLSDDRFVCGAFLNNIWVVTGKLHELKQVIASQEITRKTTLTHLPHRDKSDFLTFWHCIGLAEKDLLDPDNWQKYTFRMSDKSLIINVNNPFGDCGDDHSLFTLSASSDTMVSDFDIPDTTISWGNYGWPLRAIETDSSLDTYWRKDYRTAKKTIDYFNTYATHHLLSIDFVSNDQPARIYLLEVSDSTKAFDAFRKEMKAMDGLHYLHYRWIDRHTYYIYELSHPDYLYSFFDLPMMKKEKQVEYVTFYRQKMVVATSLDSLVAYLQKALLTISSEEEELFPDIETHCSVPCGMIDNRHYPADSLGEMKMLQRAMSVLPLPLHRVIHWRLDTNENEDHILRITSY